MEPALKQRLVGAAVLVALAVIFLPMLVQGPAPDSGVADVPLDVPDAPEDGFQTRELPLIGPPATATPEGGALGMTPPADGAQPADGDTLPATAAQPPDDAADSAGAAEATAPANDVREAQMFPAATAGGEYAVSWGSFSTLDAANAAVASLRASQLPAFREAASVGGKTVQRVRIGPYATRAEAEAARLRAAHVRDDMDAQVITLDAAPAPSPATTTPKPETPKPAAPKPAAPKPAATPPPPAAAGTGFAVQVGAFRGQADADALVARARSLGFSAFTERVATDQGTLLRVRIGPVATRAEADQLRERVRDRMGIDGLVRPHP
jgi:cell division septation protein DedD